MVAWASRERDRRGRFRMTHFQDEADRTAEELAGGSDERTGIKGDSWCFCSKKDKERFFGEGRKPEVLFRDEFVMPVKCPHAKIRQRQRALTMRMVLGVGKIH